MLIPLPVIALDANRCDTFYVSKGLQCTLSPDHKGPCRFCGQFEVDSAPIGLEQVCKLAYRWNETSWNEEEVEDRLCFEPPVCGEIIFHANRQHQSPYFSERVGVFLEMSPNKKVFIIRTFAGFTLGWRGRFSSL